LAAGRPAASFEHPTNKLNLPHAPETPKFHDTTQLAVSGIADTTRIERF